MLRSIITEVVDLIIPPRPSERIVRALTLGELEALLGEEGLPYHEPRVTALIWELKYYAHPRAARLAAALMREQVLAAAAEELGRPLLIPMPMHRARRAERGHNQTELLCEALLKGLAGAVEYAPRALVRTVNTATQQGLERTARLRNVKGSMRVVDPNRVAGRACIVIDDVATTGATFAEAKRALRAAGARAVAAVALARS